MAWFFDAEVLKAERERIFADGPGYVGHVAMVPRRGDYQSLDGQQAGWLLVHGERGPRLVSNICRHRQAAMLEGPGHASAIVCPLHRWSYDLEGRWLGSPHFDGQLCLDLPSEELTTWNGLLFRGSRNVAAELQALSAWPELHVADYVFSHSESSDLPVNWKLIIEVFLDNLHVAAFHPGFRNFVALDQIRRGEDTLLGERFAAQKIGPFRGLTQPSSPRFAALQASVLRLMGGRAPDYAAVWVFYYPNIFIELYPLMLIVSTYYPTTPEETRVCWEYYYRDATIAEDAEFVQSERAAWREVEQEDDQIAIALHRGRRLLYSAGREDWGPYHRPMEEALQRFHRALRDTLGAGPPGS